MPDRPAQTSAADESLPITIRPAESETDLSAARDLCWAYRDFLLQLSPVDAAITQAFYPTSKYTALMERLAQAHARPKGIILLALLGDQPVGCGMTHALDEVTSEIKRVYVTEPARGRGVAASLCTALVDQARADGFTRIMLDTSKSLKAAQRLYTRLGFHPCGPYQPIPDDVLPNLLFYKKAL